MSEIFKHTCGDEIKSISTSIEGMIMSRSESLYGCNRYFIQPRAGKDMKLPDGYWIDEADIKVLKPAIKKEIVATTKRGGPISKLK